MSSSLQEIYDVLITRQYQVDLFGGLKQFKRSGRSYSACCPFHNDKNPSLLIYGDKPGYFCYSCGASGDWITFLQNHKNLTFKEALLQLSEKSGIPIESNHTIKKQDSVQSLHNSAYGYFKGNVTSHSDVYHYLIQRGYTDLQIKQMEIGECNSLEDLHTFLFSLGYSITSIQESGLSSSWIGDSPAKYKLVIPYRNESGLIQGFIFRSILSSEELTTIKQPKYKYSYGLKKDNLFYQHRINPNNNSITIVEGLFDAMIMTSCGHENVVALGSAKLTEKNISLLPNNIELCYLLLDNDSAGSTGTKDAIRSLQKRNYTVKIVKLKNGFKDPDELLRSGQSFDIEKESHTWYENDIDTKCSMLGGSDDYEVYASIIENLLLAKDSLEYTLIHEYIQSKCHLSSELISEFIEKKRKAQNSAKVQKHIVTTLEKINNSDISEVDTILKELKQKVATTIINLDKESSLSYSYDQFLEELANTPDGIETGFTGIDKYANLPNEAITIVAGRPSHGKTSFMLNLLTNQINNEKYNDKKFIFFSYEETKKQLGLKLLSIISEETLSSAKNITKIKEYLVNGDTSSDLLEKGKARFKEIINNHLLLFDESFYVDDLCATITDLCEKYDVGAIFIDYITKIRIREHYGTRQQEIQRISEQILDSAKDNKVPIILGAQLGREKDKQNKVRLDNLREAGDIEQDANLVLGIYNPQMEGEDDESLKITILKNRNGVTNKETKLYFNRPTLKIGSLEQSLQGDSW